MHDDLDRLEAAVLGGSLEGVVDHVARPLGYGRYRVAGAGGSVTYQRAPGGAVTEEVVEGTHPLAATDPGHLATADEQRALPHPDPEENAFPYPGEQVAQFFDGAHAPEAVILHHPSQRPDGNTGHHGTLGVVQARGPFLAAGAGIVARGMVDEHVRMVDVGPTVVALAGGDGLQGADGRVRDELVAGPAEHVLVFLLDGCNAAALWEAVEDGDAPAIAGLVRDGTAYRHGALASLPTATLANHTAALTGRHPGHSGVLHHTWYDRGRDVTPDLLDIPAMFGARDHLAGGTETVHEALHRARPDAFTACTYEFCDRGADVSTFATMHRGERVDWPSEADTAAVTSAELLANGETAFMSRVDTASEAQARELFDPAAAHAVPAFCWVTLNVTDMAGHQAGPHSPLARAAIRDSDNARVGRVLDAVEARGVLDRTAVVVLADHGMQATADGPSPSLDDHLPPERWHVVDSIFAYERI